MTTCVHEHMIFLMAQLTASKLFVFVPSCNENQNNHFWCFCFKTKQSISEFWFHKFTIIKAVDGKSKFLKISCLRAHQFWCARWPKQLINLNLHASILALTTLESSITAESIATDWPWAAGIVQKHLQNCWFTETETIQMNAWTFSNGQTKFLDHFVWQRFSLVFLGCQWVFSFGMSFLLLTFLWPVFCDVSCINAQVCGRPVDFFAILFVAGFTQNTFKFWHWQFELVAIFQISGNIVTVCLLHWCVPTKLKVENGKFQVSKQRVKRPKSWLQSDECWPEPQTFFKRSVELSDVWWCMLHQKTQTAPFVLHTAKRNVTCLMRSFIHFLFPCIWMEQITTFWVRDCQHASCLHQGQILLLSLFFDCQNPCQMQMKTAKDFIESWVVRHGWSLERKNLSARQIAKNLARMERGNGWRTANGEWKSRMWTLSHDHVRVNQYFSSRGEFSFFVLPMFVTVVSWSSYCLLSLSCRITKR